MEVLFVCKGNVARSQMAAYFFNMLSTKHYATSAGTHVGDKEGDLVHPLVIQCMLESGHDLSDSTRTQLTNDLVQNADKIIALNKREHFPNDMNTSDVLFWEVEDPKNTLPEFHSQIRDQIRELVKQFLREIE